MANQTPYISKFKEATMNSTSSIHPPPNVFWKDLQIDHLIEKYSQDVSAPPTHPKIARAPAAFAPPPQTAFGRLKGWLGSGFSVLGKRKAEPAQNQEGGKENRKEEVRLAYEQAKELGLLPAPKVFTQPRAKPRFHTTQKDGDRTPTPTPTPSLHKTPSKKDLQKQAKLSRRVSDLEKKLHEARKELSLTLGDAPPVPALPSTLSDLATPNGRFTASSQHSFRHSASSSNLNLGAESTRLAKRSRSTLHDSAEKTSTRHDSMASSSSPNRSHFWAQDELNPHNFVENTPNLKQKITKKRKVGDKGDITYKPVSDTNDESQSEGEASRRTKKLKRSKRGSGKLNKRSTSTTKKGAVIVVPDGVTVPPLPSIPAGMEGNRVAVSDDGFGGLGHEIF
ncbi:hypothetical protein K469DRAFT_693346 [Zopfia rhizophila CBS 207.26]|uniref:Uncharacterized protein n=1 Tax=Zopfia rhizophila CBS 207.26 TaxID=1314779 RepID=A0A6A6DM51_9PEZI|nr:hypothetical protein K469DRAFT_693346 [Zopfia rhizophila CBS 207.26]